MPNSRVQQIDRQDIKALLQAEEINSLSLSQLARFFKEEIEAFLPDGVYKIDPRNGDRVLFNRSRARRPHDNRPASLALTSGSTSEDCIICQGKTTRIVDLADLSEGSTFINKNLYPVLYPLEADRQSGASGLHFLQWTSSHHERDWHNMPLSDRLIVLQRLAALEQKLLSDQRGFVLIIKNYGHLVGGSLAHGHQQIALSNVMPRRIGDNQRFEKERGETFSTYLLRENPVELLIRDYGAAVLLTPYFMRRPYDMMLLAKDASKKHLYQLSAAEIAAVAEGWCDAIRAIRSVMPDIGRGIAYNVITHNGPGAGLYFEFLPYSQETGGFEHLGLWVCQESPERAAGRIRRVLGQ